MKENQKIMGYNKSKGFEYISLHLKKYNLMMKKFISKDYNFFHKIWIFIDFVGCILKYGVGINDYFQYRCV